MSFGLISRALVGATTAGMLVVSGAGSALADEGDGAHQASPLYDTHTVRGPGAPVALPGTRVTIHTNEDGTFVRVHATGLTGPTTTGAVFIYLNPALCGGPDPNGVHTPPGTCAHVAFDSCNPANFQVVNLTEEVSKHGVANFTVALGNLPAGAEVQVYLAGFSGGTVIRAFATCERHEEHAEARGRAKGAAHAHYGASGRLD